MSAQQNLMIEGSIPKKILAFAFPLFIGNLFQQLYNTADSLIVGNFVGSSALAAVSSAGNLIFLITGFFIGLSVGAGVVISTYLGAGKKITCKACSSYFNCFRNFVFHPYDIYRSSFCTAGSSFDGDSEICAL